jgi:hypothetical protein
LAWCCGEASTFVDVVGARVGLFLGGFVVVERSSCRKSSLAMTEVKRRKGRRVLASAIVSVVNHQKFRLNLYDFGKIKLYCVFYFYCFTSINFWDVVAMRFAQRWPRCGTPQP